MNTEDKPNAKPDPSQEDPRTSASADAGEADAPARDEAEAPPAEADGARAKATTASEPTELAGAWKVGRVMLAPLLAVTAVGVHFVLNVPSERAIEHNKRRADDARAKEAQEHRARQKPANAAKTVKVPWKPRSRSELAAVSKAYRGRPLGNEPIIPEWSRKAQYFVNRAISIARRRAFDGRADRPRVSIREMRCRTVRCRFVVRAENLKDAQDLVAAIRATTVESKPIWDLFQTKDVSGQPGQPVEIRVTLTMREDEPDPKAIDRPEPPKTAEAAPAKGETPPSGPSAPAVKMDAKGKGPAKGAPPSPPSEKPKRSVVGPQ